MLLLFWRKNRAPVTEDKPKAIPNGIYAGGCDAIKLKIVPIINRTLFNIRREEAFTEDLIDILKECKFIIIVFINKKCLFI